MAGQVGVGGGVLAAAVGAGAAHEQMAGSTSDSVLAAAGRGLVAEATQSLPVTGLSQTALLVSLAFVVIVLGLLLNGLSRRHRPGDGFPPAA